MTIKVGVKKSETKEAFTVLQHSVHSHRDNHCKGIYCIFRLILTNQYLEASTVAQKKTSHILQKTKSTSVLLK